MKLKLSLKHGGIKGLLMQHGEKLAFGLTVLCLGFFVYSAAGRPVFDKVPQQLTDEAKRAKDHVAKSTWDPKEAGAEPPMDYVARAKRELVPSRPYEAVVLNNPVFEQKEKRGDPELYPVEQLQVAAGFGGFALNEVKKEVPAEERPTPRTGSGRRRPRNRPESGDPLLGGGMPTEGMDPSANLTPLDVRLPGVKVGRGARIEGRYWIVITGLVPVKKQDAAYDKAFAKAIGDAKEQEYPVYRRAVIERSAGESEDWKPLDTKVFSRFKKEWGEPVEEVVEPHFVDPLFTKPLGPLVAADWDASVAHPPQIPLLSKRDRLENEGGMGTSSRRTAADSEEPLEEEEEEEGAAKHGTTDQRRPGMGSMVGQPGGRGRSPRNLNQQQSSTEHDSTVDYHLYRYFDFSAEPGMQYRYRVRLVLENPNFGREVKFLKSPDSNKGELKETAWSEPSQTVRVPKGIRVLAKTATPKTRNNEPTTTIMVTRLDPKEGLELPGLGKDLSRGSMANFVTEAEVLDPRSVAMKKIPNVDFTTNNLVLDILGGERLSTKDKSLLAPAEVLLLDDDGNLIARNEFNDAEVIESKEPPKADESSSLRPKGGLQMPMPGGDLLGPPSKKSEKGKTKSPIAPKPEKTRPEKVKVEKKRTDKKSNSGGG